MISKTFAVLRGNRCSGASEKRQIFPENLRFTEAQLQFALFTTTAALFAFTLIGSTRAFAGAAATETEIKKARDLIYPATVRVDVRSSVFADGQRRWVRGTGSGFIYDKDGHVVTNYHVAGEAQEITCVMFNKERVKATLVGGDPWTDLAVLKLDTKELQEKYPDFVIATLGDSDKVEEGDAVIAVGAPHGLSRTVTAGIISCRDRMLGDMTLPNGQETGQFNTWLQTDAAINPGNSGGPLANMRGEVIGVNSRGGGGGLGFAVPINVVKDVVAEILKRGRKMRSDVGVNLQPLQDLEGLTGVNLNEGVLVGGVTPDSPAELAGLQARDVLLAFDGKKIAGRYPEDIFPIRSLIANTPVGKSVDVLVRRGGKDLTLSLTTEELTLIKDKEAEFKEWGLVVQPITDRMARRRNFPDTKGVFVNSLRTGLPAARAKITEGDVIISIGDATVENLDKFRELYADALANGKESILIRVRRGAAILPLVLKKSAATPN
jgi:serine protease Do